MVIGAGDATGGAVARRFAREGYIACVTRRSADKLEPLVAQIRAEGGEAHAFASDARKEEEMVALVERIERDIAPIEVAVFNIGANVRFSITETTARVYQKVWEMACFHHIFRRRRNVFRQRSAYRSGVINLRSTDLNTSRTGID